MHGRSRGNVMILRANRAVAHVSSLTLSLLFLFPAASSVPPPFLHHFFGLSRGSFSRSRDKTAQAGFRDKTEKATACICVLEIILSWRIAIHVGFSSFPLFFLRGQIDAP